MFEFKVDKFFKNYKEQEKSNFLGYADVVFVLNGDPFFKIRGIKLFQNREKQTFFVSMPSEKGKSDGKWHDIAYPITAEARTALQDAVINTAKETWEEQN